MLQRQYPEAEIITDETAQDALKHVQSSQLDLAVIDLCIPQAPGMIPQIDTGIQLLQKLMKNYPNLNIVVQNSYVKALVRIKNHIDEHQGGFTIADKGLSTKEMLARVNLALQGLPTLNHLLMSCTLRTHNS